MLAVPWASKWRSKVRELFWKNIQDALWYRKQKFASPMVGLLLMAQMIATAIVCAAIVIKLFLLGFINPVLWLPVEELVLLFLWNLSVSWYVRREEHALLELMAGGMALTSGEAIEIIRRLPEEDIPLFEDLLRIES